MIAYCCCLYLFGFFRIGGLCYCLMYFVLGLSRLLISIWIQEPWATWHSSVANFLQKQFATYVLHGPWIWGVTMLNSKSLQNSQSYSLQLLLSSLDPTVFRFIFLWSSWIGIWIWRNSFFGRCIWRLWWCMGRWGVSKCFLTSLLSMQNPVPTLASIALNMCIILWQLSYNPYKWVG